MVDDEVIKREANTHVGNDDVLMPVESVDSNLKNTVNTLLSDETSNRDHGRTQPEMFAPTPTLSLKTMLGVSSHDRNNHPKCDCIAIAIDVHTAFLHADIDQALFCSQSYVKMKFGNCTQRCMDIAKHRNCGPQHVVTLLESLNFSPSEADPSSSRNAELDIRIFIHVDDGLLFGPNIEIQRLVEHFVDSIDDAHCGTTGSAVRSNILSWQSDWENSS